MKDEGPFVLEWLAYHHLIGFSHFVVFSNDCSDTTPELLQAAERHLGFVTHHDNTGRENPQRCPHPDPQRRAYFRGARLPEIQDSDLVMVLDADEFLAIKCGEGRLQDLLDAVGPVDAMSITWRLFGTSGIERFEDRPVIAQFTQARADGHPDKVGKWGVKTICDPSKIRKFGVHRPHYNWKTRNRKTPITWVNGSGEDVYEFFRKSGWRVNRETHGADLAEVHHYALKSSESFLMKKRRGSANSSAKARLDAEYFGYFNHNEVHETRLLGWADRVSALLERWFRQFPDLRALHEASVDFHTSEIATLRGALREDDPEFLTEIGLLVPQD